MIRRAELLTRGLRKLIRLPIPAAGKQSFDFDSLAQDVAGGLSRRAALRRLVGGLAAGWAAELTGWFGLSQLPGAAAAVLGPVAGTGTCNSQAVEACLSRELNLLYEALAARVGAEGARRTVDTFVRHLRLRGSRDPSLALTLLYLGKWTEALLEAFRVARPFYTSAFTETDLLLLAFARQGAIVQCTTAGTGCPAGSRCSTNNVCCPSTLPEIKPLAGCVTICCSSGEICCAGQCTDAAGRGTPVISSATGEIITYTNCGGCGTAFTCRPGEFCFEGACVCGASALGVRRSCGPTEFCVNGTCSPCPRDQVECPRGSGICIDILNNNTSCGGCNQIGSSPLGRNCAALGQICCGGVCVDPQTSSTNCGGCGNSSTGRNICTGGQICVAGVCRCPAGQTLINGVCTSTCPAGQVLCQGQCVPLGTNQNCASCGNACTGGKVCLNNACVCPAGTVDSAGRCCATGTTNCGGTCVPTGTDVNNCGTCGNVCTGGRICTGGQCVCPAGTTLSGGICCPTGTTNCNGACVNTTSNANHCGGCNIVCTGGRICTGGQCVCPAGMTLCAGTCINTQTSPLHCGACNNPCPAGVACTNGTCGGCPAGQTNCGGTCVNTQTNNSHCGACNSPCTGGRVCSGGQCVCPAGTTLCSGVCVNTQTNASHCGACGNQCPAGSPCAGGVCGCPAGQTNCGGVCVNTQTNASHCGACGNACTGGRTCSGGQCVCPTGSTESGGICCPTGTTNCSGACVNTLTDLGNCGTCGNICPSRANATRTCVGGTCGFVCNAGFGDCDGNAANGCETNTNTSLGNCGECGNVCPAPNNGTAFCNAGTCGFNCNAGFVKSGNACVPQGGGGTCNNPIVTCNSAGGSVCSSGTCEPTAQNPQGTGFCGTTTEGTNVCFKPDAACATGCTSSAQCGAGRACVSIPDCCGPGGPTFDCVTLC